MTDEHAPDARRLAVGAKATVIEVVDRLLRDGRLTKADLARRMRTSRSAVNRLLDPARETSLPTLVAAARAVDMNLRVVLEVIPARRSRSRRRAAAPSEAGT